MGWDNNVVAYDVLPPDQLLAHPGNFRRHPAAQREALRGSLNELGVIAPVLVNRLTGHLLDGHARVEEYLSAGVEKIPVAYVEVPAEKEPLALLSLDPIAAMAEADEQALDALLREVSTDEAGLEQMLADLAKEAGLTRQEKSSGQDPGAELDRADELKEKWQVEPGQVWQVGAHRVVCGDCTDAETVERLLAGEQTHVCWTDPPWNVAYGESDHPSWKKRSIQNDNLGAAFPEFARRFCAVIAERVLPGAALYMAMSAQEWPVIDCVLREAGFHWSSTIIWAKDRPVLSRKDYHTQYEPIWYGWRVGSHRRVAVADRTQSDVWEISRPTRSDEHPTMKPVELVARALGNSSAVGDTVFEPFLGSGTTAVASEQTGRTCRGMEIEPKYVAVTLERLAGMGLEPRLES
ncbi:MAG: DNA modification methylase [Armatimonadetes bacterium]|nr:DNA modification methylase [Armatimonadota bacterium]